ncbi:hemolysin III family protein [Pediococcus argentinicus]|uniref:PAQR family membrane homeostasis protein TrhA n=1 Tax=Pediococcus argentinicus TaxID=480391 RepID=UPI00338DDFD3
MPNIFKDPKNQSKTYLILNEIFSAITHGIGVGLSIAGLVIIIVHTTRYNNPLLMVSNIIYGVSLIIFFLSSTLFHSLYFTRAQHVFRIFDHSTIYLLIAGSYTPYCLVSVGGWLGWTIFGIIWLLTILGIVYKSIWIDKFKNISTIIYVIMGWLCLSMIVPLFHTLGSTGFWLLVSGGVAYTIGALIYSLRSIKFVHVIWHLMVMIGAGLMYFSILFFVK